MSSFVSFELLDPEIEQMRQLPFGHGRCDLIAQIIVRDYLLRTAMKERRKQHEREIRSSRAQQRNDAQARRE